VPLRLAALALLTVVLAGCVNRFDATRLGVPATMASSLGAQVQGDSFRVNTTAVYGLFGLVTLSQPALDKVLAQQLVGGRGVTDLRITVRSRFTDLLVTGLTLGLVVPRTVRFEGVVTGAP
jgi:hypothetical protein